MKCLPNMVDFMTIGKDCEMKVSLARSRNKKCHSHQQFLASKCEWRFSKLGSRGCGFDCCKKNPQGGCWCTGEMQEVRWTRKQNGLQITEIHVKGISSVQPRDLHLPIHRRLNSLTWYLIFDVQTTCSLCCKLVCSLTLPWLLRPVFSELVRCCLLDSEYSPNTTVQKHQFFGTQPSLWSNSHMYTWLLEKP